MLWGQSLHPNARTDGIEDSIRAIDTLWLRLRRLASGLRELRDVWLTLVCGRCYGVPIRLGWLPDTCSVGGRSLAL